MDTFESLNHSALDCKPHEVFGGIAYNTTHRSCAPRGEQGVLRRAGIGVDVDPEGAFANSSWSGFYCDRGAGGTGTFRLDTASGCWTGHRPMIRFIAYQVAANAGQRRKDGWMTVFRAHGSAFKNQGDH